MPKPSFFGNFFGKLADLWNWITQVGQQIYSDVELIINLKSVIADDFQNLIDQFRTLTAEQQDFADRVKNLKSKAVRADVVYEFINEIRTGELKRFLVDELDSLRLSWTGDINDAVQWAQASGLVRSGQLGTTNPVLKWIQAVLKIVVSITALVHALHGIVPVVQALKDKLDSFEKVIMKQNNPRIRLKKTISARQGKLHAST
jgi:hypothetical protein